jgi:hypothetical protein
MVRLGRPATICTIYNGALPADEARLARIGLMIFNDVILRTAFDQCLDVIELRAICQEACDYANPMNFRRGRPQHSARDRTCHRGR